MFDLVHQSLFVLQFSVCVSNVELLPAHTDSSIVFFSSIIHLQSQTSSVLQPNNGLPPSLPPSLPLPLSLSAPFLHFAWLTRLRGEEEVK